MMPRCAPVLALFGSFCLIGASSAGPFQGKMFNLNGKQIENEEVEIQAFLIDESKNPIRSLFGPKNFNNGEFAFNIVATDLDPEDKAIKIVFKRKGNVTREVDGLLGNSIRPQILDVTVPDQLPCPAVMCYPYLTDTYYCPCTPSHRHGFGLFRRSR